MAIKFPKRFNQAIWLYTLLTIFYLPVLIDLVKDWYDDPNYSHGFLIIPIALYIFIKFHKQLSFPEKTNIWGIAILLFGLAILVLGSAATEFFTVRISFVICVVGIGLSILGWANFKQTWFVFFLLIFMIPIPGIIYYSATIPMQLLSSKAAHGLLQLAGIPATRAGNIINLPNYSLEVAEACSGLRSLVTLLALGAIYARFTLNGVWRPILIFIATIPIAICANIFRIFITGLGAHLISPKIADNFLHEVSGIMVFLVALGLMIILGKLLKWTARQSS
ncbi:MAG: exosortase [candidate division Zixibacteria bacterium]|nr:exosortase [candidate division Zixibacteria bacterium]